VPLHKTLAFLKLDWMLSQKIKEKTLCHALEMEIAFTGLFLSMPSALKSITKK